MGDLSPAHKIFIERPAIQNKNSAIDVTKLQKNINITTFQY